MKPNFSPFIPTPLDHNLDGTLNARPVLMPDCHLPGLVAGRP